MRERRLSEVVLGAVSRRGFLARTGRLLVALTGGSLVAAAYRAQEAKAYHFCGHIYSTASCPHPVGLPRVDAKGFALRAADGRPVDDLGRPVDERGRPVGEDSRLLRAPDGELLPRAPRTRVCDAVGRAYDFRPYVDGTWHRCCGGKIRKLVDCCGYVERRVNGDSALPGYCYAGRKVFCVMYFETKVPC